ncbi:MAG: sulfatase-like hydrolase/transferase [Phycisphaeraceae bacterium]
MPDASPNILLITTDQQRFDTIHRAGNPAIFTPHLNWLADTGVRFSRCYADSPICMASRATIMTGRHGFSNGMTDNAPDPVPMAAHPTLPGLLTKAGYQTRAIGKMHFHPARAHYGFEHMEILEDYYRQMAREGGPTRPMDHGIGQNEMEPVMATVEESRSLTRWTVERTVDFLDTRDPTRPFFVWTSFSKPHPPWDCDPKYWALYDGIDIPPPIYGDWSATPDAVPASLMTPTQRFNSADQFSPQQLRASRRAYYACITQIDYNLGYLFGRMRQLGLMENTWIIFTSDHGELLGDHWLGAKSVFLEGSAHVPMLIRLAAHVNRPSALSGTVCDELVCLADLLPTCLGIAGVAPPTQIDGLDLMRVQRGEARRDRLFGQQQHFFAVIEPQYKYHFAARDGAELLFDVKSDPYEQRELIRAGGHESQLARLRGELVDMLRKHLPEAARDGQPAPLPDQDALPAPRQRRFPGFQTPHVSIDVLH